jgi:predicted nucleic-acid-binding Zn-ribbon protein
MATSSACPRCGSRDVIANAVVQPDGQPGQVLLWKGRRHSPLTARVCGECGYTELFASNPNTLRAGARKSPRA